MSCRPPSSIDTASSALGLEREPAALELGLDSVCEADAVGFELEDGPGLWLGLELLERLLGLVHGLGIGLDLLTVVSVARRSIAADSVRPPETTGTYAVVARTTPPSTGWDPQTAMRRCCSAPISWPLVDLPQTRHSIRFHSYPLTVPRKAPQRSESADAQKNLPLNAVPSSLRWEWCQKLMELLMTADWMGSTRRLMMPIPIDALCDTCPSAARWTGR